MLGIPKNLGMADNEETFWLWGMQWHWPAAMQRRVGRTHRTVAGLGQQQALHHKLCHVSAGHAPVLAAAVDKVVINIDQQLALATLQQASKDKTGWQMGGSEQGQVPWQNSSWYILAQETNLGQGGPQLACIHV